MLLPITGLLAQNIVAAEYYIDNDEGFGQNTPIPLDEAGSEVTQSFDVDLTEISIGSHTLKIRVKDDLGHWSLATSRSFLVVEVIPEEESILTAEYFIDEDAGFGNNQPIALSSVGDDVTVTFTVDLTTYEPGIHFLYARTMNVEGRWSIVSHMPFVVVDSTELNSIVALEYYYYDATDEAIVGSDTLTYRFAKPQASITEPFLANVEALTSGESYVLYVWAINVAGRRSLVSTTRFDYCNNINGNCKQPLMIDSLAVTKIGCNESDLGKVKIFASGGNDDNYSYSLDSITFADNNEFPDLPAGSYTAYVKSGSKVVSREFTVSYISSEDECPPALTIDNLIVTNPGCDSNGTGQVEITASSDAEELMYSLDGENYTSGNVFESLEPRDYTAYVTDGENVAIEEFTIELPSEPQLNLVGEVTQPDCSNPQGGSFTVAASGGAGTGFEYSLDGTTFQENSTFNGLEAGDYTVTVRDANSCTATLDVEVTFSGDRPETPVIKAETNATTDSLSTEVILLVENVTGTFQWYLDGELIEGATTNQIELTSAGPYTVLVINGDGCNSALSTPFQVTSIEDKLAEAIRVYPNPVQAELTIALPTAITANKEVQVKLYDLQGRELLQQPVGRRSITTLDTQSLQPGIYLLWVQSPEVVLQKKIQKQ